MSDDNLRTRIAAAIAKADQDWCSDNNLHEDMADAVIRELGLRQQWGALDHENSGFLSDTREELTTVGNSETVKYRYITDWADEDSSELSQAQSSGFLQRPF